MTTRKISVTQSTVVRYAYTLLIILMLPISVTFLVVRKLKGQSNVSTSSWNRIGLAFKTKKTDGILIHCVSVGEVVAAAPIIHRLKQITPARPIYITTTTETGAQRVEQLFADKVEHFYLPLDVPLFVLMMLRALRPTKVLITEVELWPNLIHACWKQNTPVFVINARMTDKSARRYQNVSWLFAPMLEKLEGVCAQGKRDFDNYLKLGMNQNRLHLTNNIKFDRAISEGLDGGTFAAKFNLQERKSLVAGSTHDGEELLLLNAYKRLKETFPSLLLVLVPRHPQRFDKVYQLCEQQGMKVKRFTSNTHCQDSTDVFLVDAMGQLENVYQIADITFVGGSINPRGGHNALEPASYGVPIMMGSSRFNNPLICEALAEKGALVTTDSLEELVAVATTWLNNSDASKIAGQSGRQVIKDNQGAVDATLDVITALH